MTLRMDHSTQHNDKSAFCARGSMNSYSSGETGPSISIMRRAAARSNAVDRPMTGSRLPGCAWSHPHPEPAGRFDQWRGP